MKGISNSRLMVTTWKFLSHKRRGKFLASPVLVGISLFLSVHAWSACTLVDSDGGLETLDVSSYANSGFYIDQDADSSTTVFRGVQPSPEVKVSIGTTVNSGALVVQGAPLSSHQHANVRARLTVRNRADGSQICQSEHLLDEKSTPGIYQAKEFNRVNDSFSMSCTGMFDDTNGGDVEAIFTITTTAEVNGWGDARADINISVGAFSLEVCRQTENARWVRLSGGARDIGIGADGTAYIIGTNTDVPAGNGRIYRWNGSGWTRIGGYGRSIAADPEGRWWIVNTRNEIWNPEGRMPGTALDVAIGADGTIFKLGTDTNVPTGNGRIYEWTGSSWRSVGGHGSKIAVDPRGRWWIVNTSGEVWGPNGRMPGKARDIAVGADGSIYKLGMDTDVPAGNGRVYRWNGSQWVGVGGYGAHIAVDPDGNPWIVNHRNEIWKVEG